METIRVRFVGGPWHNQLRDVIPDGKIQVVQPTEPTSSWDKALLAILGCRPEAESTYTLCRFQTTGFQGGADFLQYIHESRFFRGRPDIWTCNESFPTCQLDITELEALELRSIQARRNGLLGEVEQESL